MQPYLTQCQYGFFMNSFKIIEKKGAMIEIAARINPISYEKPFVKRTL